MPTLLYAAVFLSGAASLAYEVLWARYLSAFLGSTVRAHAAVLSAFMGGLALGSVLLGRRADRAQSPLRLYGWLELGIGLYGLGSPAILSLASQAYVALARGRELPPLLAALFQLTLSADALLVPTILMGGTLPAMTRCLAGTAREVGSGVSRLYFLNCAGASLGALAAGCLLIPVLGLDASTRLAAAASVAVGLLCLGLGAGAAPGGPARPGDRSEVPDGGMAADAQAAWAAAAVFASGAAALAYETAWIRLFSIVLGSTAYSFALMLAAFILGTALGSLLVARRVLPSASPGLLLGASWLGAAASVALTVPFYERLAYASHHLGGGLPRTDGGFYLYQAVQLSLCLLLTLPTALFLGMTLPLACRLAARGDDRIGSDVGGTLGANALGAVLGAALTGPVLLPWLGLRGVLEAGLWCHALLGAAFAWNASPWSPPRKAAALAACALALMSYLRLAPWLDPKALNSGVYLDRGAGPASYAQYRESLGNASLLYHSEDGHATVTVWHYAGRNLALRVNGRSEASLGVDMDTQVLAAHIPLLLKPEAERVLVVGLGSGVTAGSALRHPLESLDIVEISPGVAEASRFFKPHNNSPLEDPRTRLVLEDAKAFLKLTQRRYDAVISEPSQTWVAGIGGLYTAEFYRDVRARLRPGGVLAQWFHAYDCDDETLRLVLRTVASAFPEVTVWAALSDDLLLVASDAPLRPDFGRMALRAAQAEIRQDLRRVGVEDLATLLSLQAASDPVARSAAGAGPLNEDRFPRLEYASPRTRYLGSRAGLIRAADERLAGAGGGLALTRYLESRGRPAAPEEFKSMARYHRKYDPAVYRAVVGRWLGRYPKDPEARTAARGVSPAARRVGSTAAGQAARRSGTP